MNTMNCPCGETAVHGGFNTYKVNSLNMLFVRQILILLYLFLFTHAQDAIFSDPLFISTNDTNGGISSLPAAAVDKNGYLHVVYTGLYYDPMARDSVAGEIYYTNNLTGSFSPPVKLPSLISNIHGYSKEPSIAIDSNGTIHIAYYRCADQLSGIGQICYTNNKNGIFSTPKLIFVDSLDPYCSFGIGIQLAVGKNSDSIHVGFCGNPGTGDGTDDYTIGKDGVFNKPIHITNKEGVSSVGGVLGVHPIHIDNQGIPTLLYWINSDTINYSLSKKILIMSKIVNGTVYNRDIVYNSNSSTGNGEIAFAMNQYDSLFILYRGAGASGMNYIVGKNGNYSIPQPLPTNTAISLMYSIKFGSNNLLYIAYKQAGNQQSVGFMFKDGNGFTDVSPSNYTKYGFMSSGPQWFAYDNKNKKGYLVYTTGRIYVVTIDLDTPAIPLNGYPSNQSTNISASPMISWSPSIKAMSYRFQIASDSSFNGVLKDTIIVRDTAIRLSNLSPSTKYFWRVNARGAGGMSGWSEARSFTTVSINGFVPILSSPSNDAPKQPLSLTLKWNPVSGALTYRVQLTKLPSLTNMIVDDSTLTSATRNVGPLSPNTTYYWRVNATNEVGTSLWSNVWVFITGPVTAVLPTKFEFHFKGISSNASSIRYAIPTASDVFIRIYSIQGRLIKTILNSYQQPGFYQIPSGILSVSKGFYILDFKAGSNSIKQKISTY